MLKFFKICYCTKLAQCIESHILIIVFDSTILALCWSLHKTRRRCLADPPNLHVFNQVPSVGCNHKKFYLLFTFGVDERKPRHCIRSCSYPHKCRQFSNFYNSFYNEIFPKILKQELTVVCYKNIHKIQEADCKKNKQATH